jgi:hypothetical protein
VTFIGLKVGLFTGDAADVVGELVFNDCTPIRSCLRAPVQARRLNAGNLHVWLRVRLLLIKANSANAADGRRSLRVRSC